jgi:hypothetical protein
VLSSGERSFITLEVPLSIRKNFSRWLSSGIGVSPLLVMVNGSNIAERRAVLTDYATRINSGTTPQEFVFPEREISLPKGNSIPYQQNRLEYSLFGDIHLGAVRAGPSIGLRGGLQFNQQFKFRHPFAQLSFEIKL